MNFQVFYASDGVVLQRGVALLVDQAVELPPGKYNFKECRVNSVEIDSDTLESTTGFKVEPLTDDALVKVHLVKYPPPEVPAFTEVEPTRPDDHLAPYEAMYRLMAKLYDGRTDEELDESRSRNIEDIDYEEDDVRMVVSQFGTLREKWDEEDEVEETDPEVEEVKEEPVEDVAEK